MDKFNLNVRIRDLEVGNVFWFSARWHCVTKIDDQYLYYKLLREEDDGWRIAGYNETVMRGSQMMVEVKPDKFIIPKKNGKP